jgi:hypothetical protein
MLCWLLPLRRLSLQAIAAHSSLLRLLPDMLLPRTVSQYLPTNSVGLFLVRTSAELFGSALINGGPFVVCRSNACGR